MSTVSYLLDVIIYTNSGVGTPLYDLYRYVPLDRVWFFAFLS